MRSASMLKVACGLISLAIAPVCSAQLLAYEGFNYVEDPGTSIVGLAGGIGWDDGGAGWPAATGTNPAATLSSGLSFPGVNDTIGQAMRYGANTNLSTGRAWDSNPVADGVYWYSFMVRPEFPSGAANGGRGTFVPFRDPTGTADGQNGAGLRIDDNGGSPQFKAWTPTQSAGANIEFPGGYNRNYFVFGRLIVDTSAPTATSNTIWVIQDSSTLPEDEGSLDSITTTSTGLINNIGGVTNLSPIWSGRGFSNNTGLNYDELRVGLSFGDVLPGLGPVVPTWVGPVSSDWFRASNWQASAIPNAVDASAIFRNASSPRTVFTDQAVTVGSLTFGGANRFNITGNGTLTLDVTSGNASITVESGSHKINLPLSLNDTTDANVAAGAELEIADPLTLNGNTLNVSGDGTVSIISTVNAGSGTLRVSGAALQLGTNLNGAGLDVASGSVSMAASQKLSSLQVATGGDLDIADALVVVDYDVASPLASIVASRNAGDLTSSTLTGTTAVAVVDNAALQTSSFGGMSVDATSILIRRTLRGDTDMNGNVGFSDLLSLAQNYNVLSGAGWEDGDSDFNGSVDFADLLALAQNYNQALSLVETQSLLSTFGADFASDWSYAVSVIPEPATVGLVIGSMFAMRMRRR